MMNIQRVGLRRGRAPFLRLHNNNNKNNSNVMNKTKHDVLPEKGFQNTNPRYDKHGIEIAVEQRLSMTPRKVTPTNNSKAYDQKHHLVKDHRTSTSGSDCIYQTQKISQHNKSINNIYPQQVKEADIAYIEEHGLSPFEPRPPALIVLDDSKLLSFSIPNLHMMHHVQHDDISVVGEETHDVSPRPRRKFKLSKRTRNFSNTSNSTSTTTTNSTTASKSLSPSSFPNQSFLIPASKRRQIVTNKGWNEDEKMEEDNDCHEYGSNTYGYDDNESHLISYLRDKLCASPRMGH